MAINKLFMLFLQICYKQRYKVGCSETTSGFKRV